MLLSFCLFVFQEVDFGDVYFSMIGDDSAVNFFRIESDTGLIRTRQNSLINSDKDVYVVSENNRYSAHL